MSLVRSAFKTPVRRWRTIVLFACYCLLSLLGHAADEYTVRCTAIMQTRADRVYCYATNKPFRVILKEPQQFSHGEVFEATSSELNASMVESIPTLVDARVKRTGITNLPAALRVTPGELRKGDLNFYRVAMRGRVQSHEWMYFQNRHIEVVVLQGADGPFRVNILKDFSNARERWPVGAEVDVVGLSFLEVFAAPRGPEVQVDVENLNESTTLRDAPWLTFEVARRLVVIGGLAAVFGVLWFIRERRIIARLDRSEAVTRSINYFATSLLERDNEEEILWDLSKNCVARLGFVDCVIYLLDRGSNQLIQKAAYGPKNPTDRKILNPIVLPIGNGIVGHVAKSGQAELIADTREDPRYIVDDERRLSEIAVPIVANGEVLGVIDSEHPRENFFTPEHLQILKSIASLCANKLVRVRAEQSVRTLNVELEQRVAARTAELATANTQLKQAEQDLRKALSHEKELGQLKSRFISMVSHEFRTPLAIIMSSAEILEAYLDRLAPEERASNIKDIFDASRHMGSMVDEVLFLSRAEAGKLKFKPARVNLKDFCERTVDEMASATNRRCRIVLQDGGNMPDAQADEALLRHIFTNLLDNAVKYSPAGSRVDFSIAARGDSVEFVVRDRGVGIAQSDLRQLFQAFHRGENVGEAPGTGLGLAIVKYCVDLHQGTIAVESREGEGSTFTVTLPVLANSAVQSTDCQHTASTAAQV